MSVIKQTKETGSALIISLIFLTLLTIIGISAIQNTNMQEIMASNTRQSQESFNVAEIGLRRAEDQAVKSSNDIPCESSFVATFKDETNHSYTTLTTQKDQITRRFANDFCGPIRREITDGISALSGDGAGNIVFETKHYIAVSKGDVGGTETYLVSAFASDPE